MRMLLLLFAFVALLGNTDCRPHKNKCFFWPTKQSYKVGITWNYSACVSCTCLNVGVQCLQKVCQEPACIKPLRKTDGCCEICSDNCYDEDRKQVVKAGKSFLSPDGCMLCECKSGGQLTCVSKKCPPILCHESMVIPGPNCCPTCRPGCYDSKYGHGEIAVNSTFVTHKGCTICQCLSDGAILCKTKQCPETPCHQTLQADPEPGKCCKTCRPGCYDSEHGHGAIEIGRTFNSIDMCKLCTCYENGTIGCEGRNCYIPCHQALWLPLQPGQCCPTCKQGCYDDKFGLNEIAVDEKKITTDNCIQCTCIEANELQCMETKSPECMDE